MSMDPIDLHERIQEAERLRIQDHENAERAYQKRFSEALKAAGEAESDDKQPEENNGRGA